MFSKGLSESSGPANCEIQQIYGSQAAPETGLLQREFLPFSIFV